MASAEAKPAAAKPTEETKVEEPQKPAAVVGEDDEFEDFPVDGMYFVAPLPFRHPSLAILAVLSAAAPRTHRDSSNILPSCARLRPFIG